MIKEQWERFALFHKGITLSLTKNEQFARKTNEKIPNPEELAYSNLCSANFAHFQPSWHQPFDLSIALLLYRLGLNLERVINYAGKVASVQGYDGYRFITFVWNSPYFFFRSHSS